MAKLKGYSFCLGQGHPENFCVVGFAGSHGFLLVPKASRVMPALYYSFILNREAFCFHCSCFEMEIWRKK